MVPTAGSSSAFRDLLERACASQPQLKVELSQGADSFPYHNWILVSNADCELPEQGWKVHVSATVLSATEVLRQTLPILLEAGAHFKVAESIEMLAVLNRGESGLSQVGKFITIYPVNDLASVAIAVAVARATNGLPGPRIPTDRSLRGSEIVSYRYGGFRDRHLQTPTGEYIPAIKTPDGALVPDERSLTFRRPEWAVDPFEAAGLAAPLSKPNDILLNGRYLKVSRVDRSARGDIYLAVDVMQKKPCILKQATRHALVSMDGKDAIDHLKHEFYILTALSEACDVPKTHDFFYCNDGAVLAMDDVEGTTLSKRVWDVLASGSLIHERRVISWAIQLASILEQLHRANFIYRDLKSTNVIVQPNDHLKLIDFELACEVGSAVSNRGIGTRGYMSPQQLNGDPASIADDVYGLGALVYFLVTGAEPAHAPNEEDLLSRPIRLLNPNVSEALAEIIETCLSNSDRARYSSMAELRALLQDLDRSIPGEPTSARWNIAVSDEAQARSHYAKLARQLGDTICQAAIPGPGAGSLAWISTYNGRSLVSADLNTGVAGTVLALAELVREFGDAAHRETLVKGARWLTNAVKTKDANLPGLYVGLAGAGTALLRAGQVLGDENLLATAGATGARIAREYRESCRSPDVFNGKAGVLRFHLMLWRHLQQPEHLEHACALGRELVELAEFRALRKVCWRIPAGYSGLSGNVYLGYAHGAAGIGDCLLELGLETDDACFLGAAADAGAWLAELAVPTGYEGSAVNWPDIEGGTLTWPFWCHGSTGIGIFFLHLAEAGVLPHAINFAARAAVAANNGARWSGPTLCHGLAGNIEFLLDMEQFTGVAKYLAQATQLGAILEAFAREIGERVVWRSDNSEIVTPDLMVGYAGVALCLLRLGTKQSASSITLWRQ